MKLNKPLTFMNIYKTNKFNDILINDLIINYVNFISLDNRRSKNNTFISTYNEYSSLVISIYLNSKSVR